MNNILLAIHFIAVLCTIRPCESSVPRVSRSATAMQTEGATISAIQANGDIENLANSDGSLEEHAGELDADAEGEASVADTADHDDFDDHDGLEDDAEDDSSAEDELPSVMAEGLTKKRALLTQRDLPATCERRRRRRGVICVKVDYMMAHLRKACDGSKYYLNWPERVAMTSDRRRRGATCLHPSASLSRRRVVVTTTINSAHLGNSQLCQCYNNWKGRRRGCGSHGSFSCYYNKVCNCPNVCGQFKTKLGCNGYGLIEGAENGNESNMASAWMSRMENDGAATQQALDGSLSGKCG